MNTLENHRLSLHILAREHGISRLRVFGSFGRGDATDLSDVDFLVELLPERTLFDLGGFQVDAQELLGRKVDVVTAKGLRASLRERILQEACEL